MYIDICNRADGGRRRGGQVFGSSSVSVPELFGDGTVIPVLGESWRGVKLWKMGQLVTITFCRETFHYSIPLISAVSKKGLGLFPMKDFPYIFALFSTLYLYLFTCFASCNGCSCSSQLLGAVSSSSASGSFCCCLNHVPCVRLWDLQSPPFLYSQAQLLPTAPPFCFSRLSTQG